MRIFIPVLVFASLCLASRLAYATGEGLGYYFGLLYSYIFVVLVLPFTLAIYLLMHFLYARKKEPKRGRTFNVIFTALMTAIFLVNFIIKVSSHTVPLLEIDQYQALIFFNAFALAACPLAIYFWITHTGKSSITLVTVSLMAIFIIPSLSTTNSNLWYYSDNVRRVKILKQRAENGDLASQRQLAGWYDLGIVVKVDVVEGAKWELMAAKQGDAQAQFLIGKAYKIGRGLQQSPAEAAKWFLAAANQGHRDAQTALGNLHMAGDGVPLSYAEAYFWYSLTTYGFTDNGDKFPSMVDTGPLLSSKSRLTAEEAGDIDARVANWKPAPKKSAP